MMKTCKVCGNKVRKTNLALVSEDGILKSGRVCQDCLSKHGVTIVLRPAVKMCKCGQPATKCHVCAGSKSGDLTSAIATLRGRLKTAKVTPVLSEHLEGRIEGLESAIELLESGRF
jgi:hypothetical protein